MSGLSQSMSHEHDWRDLAAQTRTLRHVPFHSSASVDRSFTVTASSSLSPSKRSRSLSPSGMTDIDYIDYPDHTPHQHSPSSSIDDTPQRTLRRTKRMILRSSQSTPQRSETDLATTATSHSTPEPHTHPLVPLGHPSRPYYSAIRKNMSRPSSPFDATHHNTPHTSHFTPTASPLLHSISLGLPDDSDDDDDEKYNNDPRSSSAFAFAMASTTSRIFTPPVSGFSLSGETEMRMALARLRAQQHADASSGEFSEYEFRQGSVRNRKRWVRSQMKRLGRAFKHLVVSLSVKVAA